MNPIRPLILLVALFWTLPASAAMLVSRTKGRSIDGVRHTTEGAPGIPQAQDK